MYGSVAEGTTTRPYLLRATRPSWSRIDVPFADPIRAASIGKDGSAWLVTGTGFDTSHPRGDVWRVDLSPLRFTRVALPDVPCAWWDAGRAPTPNRPASWCKEGSPLVPLDVVARSAEDVWLATHQAGSSLTPLLHTQRQQSPKTLPTYEELAREAPRRPAPPR